MSDTVTPKKTKLLAEQEIKDSMTDERFYEAMPEFLPIRAKMKAVHSDVVSARGCAPCAKRKAYAAYAGDYLRIAQRLTDDGKVRMRMYFGVDELRATVLDPETQKPRTIAI